MLLTHSRHCNAISQDAHAITCYYWQIFCFFFVLGASCITILLGAPSCCLHQGCTSLPACKACFSRHSSVHLPVQQAWSLAETCLMLQMEGRGRCQLDPVVSINQAGQNYTNRIVPAAADGKEQRAGCRARRDRWLASMRRHPCIQHRGLTGPGLRAAAHGRVIRYMLTCINTLLL